MFSKRLKELRTSLDLSQAQFASEIGFSQSAIVLFKNTLPHIFLLLFWNETIISHQFEIVKIS